METFIRIDQPNATAPQERRKARTRRPLPPQENRDWLTPYETALALGCSIATVHRLRRGLLVGLEPLPFTQYGRKIIFRKTSVAAWCERIEKSRLAA